MAVFEPRWPQRRVYVPLGLVAASVGAWNNTRADEGSRDRGGACPHVLTRELCSEAVLRAANATQLKGALDAVGSAVEAALERVVSGAPAQQQPVSDADTVCDGGFCNDSDLSAVFVAALVTASTRFTLDGALVTWLHLSEPRNWSRFESAVPHRADRAYVIAEIAARLPAGGVPNRFASIVHFITKGVNKDSFGSESEREALGGVIERSRLVALALADATLPPS